MESYDLGTPVDPRLRSGPPRPGFAPQLPPGLQDPRRYPQAPAQRSMTSLYQGQAPAPFCAPGPYLHFMPPPVAMGAMNIIPPPNFNHQIQLPSFNQRPTFPIPPISPQPHPLWRPHPLAVPPPPHPSFSPRFQPPLPQHFPEASPGYVNRSAANFNPMGGPPPYHGGMLPGGVTPDMQPDQFVRKWLEDVDVSTHKETKATKYMTVSTFE